MKQFFLIHFVFSLSNWFIRSMVDSFIASFFDSFIRWFPHSLVVYGFIYWFIHSVIRAPILSPRHHQSLTGRYCILVIFGKFGELTICSLQTQMYCRYLKISEQNQIGLISLNLGSYGMQSLKNADLDQKWGYQSTNNGHFNQHKCFCSNIWIFPW
jgi:hypothetical protein